MSQRAKTKGEKIFGTLVTRRSGKETFVKALMRRALPFLLGTPFSGGSPRSRFKEVGDITYNATKSRRSMRKDSGKYPGSPMHLDFLEVCIHRTVAQRRSLPPDPVGAGHAATGGVEAKPVICCKWDINDTVY